MKKNPVIFTLLGILTDTNKQRNLINVTFRNLGLLLHTYFKRKKKVRLVIFVMKMYHNQKKHTNAQHFCVYFPDIK